MNIKNISSVIAVKKILGDGNATYTFSSSDPFVSNSTATFLVGAVSGSTTLGALGFTLTGQI
jgi:hypothetical protein